MEMNRRSFMGAGAALFAAAGCRAVGGGGASKDGDGKVIAGFDDTYVGRLSTEPWKPYSDRKVRVGIAGEGFCQFGSAFAYQTNPNVEVVACTDLDPKRCALLQQRVGAKKTYPSCEEMIKHAAADKLEAVYIATDARSHVQLAIMALEHGLNVATAVPAILGKDQLEYVPKLLDAVKRSGKIYMMNETSAFRPECFMMRRLYESGAIGRMTYCEGEYFHFGGTKPDDPKQRLKAHDHFSYKGWRWGLPPMYYPTHSNAFYTCVTHKRFTEVSCRGTPSQYFQFLPEGKNEYGNPFGSEYATYRCEEGATARMLVAFDTPNFYAETGRIWGQNGCYVPEHNLRAGKFDYFHGLSTWAWDEVMANKNNYFKPQLAPGTVNAGGHGGSHAYLTDDFIRGIILPDHKVCVDVVTALNTTVSGIYAHLSAMKDGETLKIPEIAL